MTYKQGLSLVREAADFGLDMQSQVHICVDGTRENWYPAEGLNERELPPHIAIWVDWELFEDFEQHLYGMAFKDFSPNEGHRVEDSVTGDEYIYLYFLED